MRPFLGGLALGQRLSSPTLPLGDGERQTPDIGLVLRCFQRKIVECAGKVTSSQA